MSAKHEVHYSPNAKIMKIVLSCHSNSFLRQQVLPDIVVAPGDMYSKYRVCMLSTAPNLKFIHLQIAMLQQYVSVAMVTIFHSNL